VFSHEAVAQPNERDSQDKECECDPNHDKVHAPILAGRDLKVEFGIGASEYRKCKGTYAQKSGSGHCSRWEHC